jgi:hypothetical protein
VPHHAPELLCSLTAPTGPLEDVSGHVPKAKLEGPSQAVASGKCSQQSERIIEPAKVSQRSGTNDRGLHPSLGRDGCPQGPSGRFHGFLRRAQCTMAVCDEMVLVHPAGDPPIGLKLPKGFPEESLTVERDPEDLTHRPRPRGQILRRPSGPHGRGVASPLQQADRFLEGLDRPIGLSCSRRRSDLLQDGVRS